MNGPYASDVEEDSNALPGRGRGGRGGAGAGTRRRPRTLRLVPVGRLSLFSLPLLAAALFLCLLRRET